MEWEPPVKPNELTETRLIAAILNGTFPIDSNLPAERELCGQLGVTRPTLREALQRLTRDGWLEICQGKPTRVRNYWQEGNLAVLAAIATHQQNLPADFVPNLLTVRLLMAPTYARLAVQRAPDKVAGLLSGYLDLPEDPETYTQADWNLHFQLTLHSGNPVFTLILNGFQDLYLGMGRVYFANPAGRASSRRFYHALHQCAQTADPAAAGTLVEAVMQESLTLWEAATSPSRSKL